MLASPSRRAGALCLTALLTLASAACTAAGENDASGGPRAQDQTSGPLCDQLPKGNEPGGPTQLAEMSADVALTWIPVLTVFEAAARATGVADDLATTDGVTILAPTDEAFHETFTEATLDDLILFRQDELRILLQAHMIEGAQPLSDLLEARRLRDLAGDRLRVAPAPGGMARIDDRAVTLCADYEARNARIHVIDAVLGDLPEPAPEEPEIGG